MGTRRRRVSVKYGRSKLVKWDDLRMELINNVTEDVIKKAAQALKDGHLVAFPTETVYGLGADATNPKAISRIYSVKGRPTNHPLIVHISSINQLDKWTINVPEYAINLARTFWPGPVTLILKRSKLAREFITGGQDNIGIRVPAHPIALQLLHEFEKLDGLGIAAPSANKFGAVSPTNGNDVNEEIGTYLSSKDLILNGGQCSVGIESTIIDCISSSPNILRPGAITSEMIGVIAGIKISNSTSRNQIKVSGLLVSHYSPKARVLLDSNAEPGEGFIAMADISTPKGAIRLTSPATVEQFAKNLYKALRLCDQMNLKKVIVIQPSGGGLSLAIRDRLSKSASNKYE